MEIRNIENSKVQKKEQEKPVVTRAEKANRMKGILRALLEARDYKWNELLDASARAYADKFPGEIDDMNDLKGKMGSVLSLMEDAGETRFEAGICSLAGKSGKNAEKEEKKPAKAEAKASPPEKGGAEKTEEKAEEKAAPAAKKRAGRKPKAETAKAEAVKTETAKPEAKAEAKKSEKKPEEKPAEETKTEAPAPKRRGRKPKAEAAKVEEAKAETAVPEAKAEEAPAEKLVEKPVEAAGAEATKTAETVGVAEGTTAEAPAPRRRGRKPKAEPAKAEAVKSEAKPEAKEAQEVQKPEELKEEEKAPLPIVTPVPAEVEKPKNETDRVETKEETPAEKKEPAAEKTEVVLRAPAALEAKSAPVFDMTLLFGNKGKSGKTASPAPASAPVKKLAEETPAMQAQEPKREETALQPIAAKMQQEPKRAAMPEFAFLGNASVKGASAAERREPLSRETKDVRPAPAARAEAERRQEKEQPAPVQAKAQNTAASAPSQARNQPSAKARETAKEGGQVSAVGANSSGNGRRGNRRGRAQTPAAPETPEEALKAEFLKKLRSLGGDYFEYYSVYLLERYSLRNGRRLEGLRISGGERDGGIDGEIELTDKFGFRETIYIQSKNWDPSKGDLEKWVVGETLLQQFIGAVTCRLAKVGKQHSRGIFITTSHFTPEAKALLETMSDRFIGYDSDDVFEAAKECSFGLIKKDGEWALDEELLSGGKAFFNLM